MKAKSILANATVIIICVCIFLSGYASSLKIPVYADSTTDEWTQVTTNQQLVEAFRYYCKSRDLTIEGSVADAVTNFTTKTFNGLCNTLGIDVTALQAQLKYQTDGNTGIRFLFSATGVNAYNRIFAQFLQDNDLQVGDSADQNNNTVANGYWFEDLDGHGCYCFTPYTSFTSQNSSCQNSNVNQVYTSKGTPYIYNSNDLIGFYDNNGFTTSIIHITNSISGTFIFTRNNGSSVNRLYYKFSIPNTNKELLRYVKNESRFSIKGYPCIVRNNNGDLWLAVYWESYDSNNNPNLYTLSAVYSLESNNASQSIVYLTTNNTVINNNNYEGDTIINNYGTPSNPSTPDPEPDNPDYNPYPDGGGTVTPPGNVGGNGSDGTINFPDFNINLPEINWSLGDLSQKFPFSIPFDMIAFLTLLNGEPQAPHITGSIPLTSHYTWNLDFDFAQFDTFAGIMRGLEFVGFMFFLISATINIVRG